MALDTIARTRPRTGNRDSVVDLGLGSAPVMTVTEEQFKLDRKLLVLACW